MKSLRAALVIGAMIAVAGFGGLSEAYGLTVTADLRPVSVTPGQATFDLFLTFPGAAGDVIQAVNLSAFGSSPVLTGNDTDFSRFAFGMDSTTLQGWDELVLMSTGRGFYAPGDPVNGPFVAAAAAPQRLGQLAVDLAGLPAGSYFVTLAADGPDFGTDLAGVIGGVDVFSFRNSQEHQLVFAQPDGVSFRVEGAVVPEPLTLVGGMIGFAAAGIQALRRRRMALTS